MGDRPIRENIPSWLPPISRYGIIALILLLVSCKRDTNTYGEKYIPVATVTRIATTVPIRSIGARLGKYISFPSTPAPAPMKIVWPTCLHYVGQYYGQNGEEGTDFDCSFHTKMFALWQGTLIKAERTCWNDNCTSTSGGIVIINSFVPGIGLVTTYYLHMDTLNRTYKVGDAITKGEYLGLTGGQLTGGNWNVSSWFSTGPHIEIGFDASFICNYLVRCLGRNVNPLPYIQEEIRNG